MGKLLSIALLVLLGAPVWSQTNTSIGLENGVYSSVELGFRYRLPSGLSDETSYARESLQKKAADLHTTNTFDVLLRVTSGPDDSVPEWHAISIQSYSRAKFVDRDDGAVEARMNQLVAGSGTAAVGKSERESIAGVNFTVSNFEKSEPPLEKHARVYSTVLKGKVLSIAFTANQRTREICIRKILGAGVLQLVSLLSLEFILLVGLSIVIAVPLAGCGVHQWFQDFAYHTSMPWWIFVLAGVAALAIALLTVSFQAIRAVTANPAKNLRVE